MADPARNQDFDPREERSWEPRVIQGENQGGGPGRPELHVVDGGGGDGTPPSDRPNLQLLKGGLSDAESAASKTPNRPKDLAAQEANPAGWSSTIKGRGQRFAGRNLSSTIKKVRLVLAGAGIISAVTGAVVAGVLGFFVTMKERALDFWSKNQYSAYNRRAASVQKRLFQEPDADCKTIRCRLKQGVSDKEIAKYQKAGLRPEVGEKGGKKYIIAFNFVDENGKEVRVTQANFKEVYKSSPKFLGMVSVVSKSKAIVYRGQHALKKYSKFGVDRAKKALVDSKKKFRAYMFGDTGQPVNLNPGDDAEEDPEKPPEQAAVEGELGDAEEAITEAAAEDKAQMVESEYENGPAVQPDTSQLDQDPANAANVGEGLLKGGLKGAVFSVFSVIDKACGGYQLIRAVIFGAKIYAAAQLIQYALLFMTHADALKAGELSYTQIAFMAGILILPNKVKGPDYGKTAANSILYSMIVGLGKVSSKTGLARFSNGTAFMKFLQTTKAYFESLGANKTTCKHVQAWYGQVALGALGLLASIGTGGLATIVGIAQGAVVGAITSVMIAYVTPMLIRMANDTHAPDPDDPEGGFAAGNAIGSGIGAFAGQLARGSLRLLTNDDAPQVAMETAREMARIKAAERIGQNPFSIDNPDSITNRLAMVVAPYVFAPTAQANYQNIASIAASPLTLIGGSINQLFTSRVNALETSYGGQFCADEDYRDMNILTDAYCNPIYGEQEAVIESPKYEPDQVTNFMADNGHVDETTGAPKSDDFQKFIRSCVDGDAPPSPDGGGAEVGEDIDTRDCLKGDKTGTAATPAKLARSGQTQLAQAAPTATVTGDDKFTMFRMYLMDTDILDGIQKSADGTLGAGGADGGGSQVGSAPLNPGAFTWPINPSGASTISSCMNLTDPSYRQHAGLDIAAPIGTQIVAVADGTVVFESKSVGGFEYYVAIKHANGAITGYGHNQQNLVKQGDIVKQGQPIATVGSRGQSTGPHVHMNYIPDGSNHFTNPDSIAYNPLYNNLMPKPANVVDDAGCMSPQKLKAR